MKLVKVFMLLEGISLSCGHYSGGGWRRRPRWRRSDACGKIAIVLGDNKKRTNHCEKDLTAGIEGNFRVEVVTDVDTDATDYSFSSVDEALDTIYVDKDMSCSDVIEEALEDIEEELHRKYGPKRASRCVRDRSRRPKGYWRRFDDSSSSSSDDSSSSKKYRESASSSSSSDDSSSSKKYRKSATTATEATSKATNPSKKKRSRETTEAPSTQKKDSSHSKKKHSQLTTEEPSTQEKGSSPSKKKENKDATTDLPLRRRYLKGSSKDSKEKEKIIAGTKTPKTSSSKNNKQIRGSGGSTSDLTLETSKSSGTSNSSSKKNKKVRSAGGTTTPKTSSSKKQEKVRSTGGNTTSTAVPEQ